MLIQAPYAVECFEENTVVLPMTVLEELDNMKKEEGEKGANVRKVIRILDAHREKGNLLEGVRMEWGGTLRVEKNYRNVELPPDLPEHKSDKRYSFAYQSTVAWNSGRGLWDRAGCGT